MPAGGLNSNVDAGIGARVWLEYVVTIRSPFGKSMSVRSTRNSSVDSQIKLLKHSFHRPGARQQCSSFPLSVLVAVTLKLVSIFSRFSAELIAATVASSGEPLPNG